MEDSPISKLYQANERKRKIEIRKQAIKDAIVAGNEDAILKNEKRLKSQAESQKKYMKRKNNNTEDNNNNKDIAVPETKNTDLSTSAVPEIENVNIIDDINMEDINVEDQKFFKPLDHPSNLKMQTDMCNIFVKEPHSIFEEYSQDLVHCNGCNALLISKKESQLCCKNKSMILTPECNPAISDAYMNLLVDPIIQTYAHIFNRNLSAGVLITNPSVKQGGRGLERPKFSHHPGLAMYTLSGRTYGLVATGKEGTLETVFSGKLYWNEDFKRGYSIKNKSLHNRIMNAFNSLYLFLIDHNPIFKALKIAQQIPNYAKQRVLLQMQKNQYSAESEISLLIPEDLKNIVSSDILIFTNDTKFANPNDDKVDRLTIAINQPSLERGTTFLDARSQWRWTVLYSLLFETGKPGYLFNFQEKREIKNNKRLKISTTTTTVLGKATEEAKKNLDQAIKESKEAHKIKINERIEFLKAGNAIEENDNDNDDETNEENEGENIEHVFDKNWGKTILEKGSLSTHQNHVKKLEKLLWPPQNDDIVLNKLDHEIKDDFVDEELKTLIKQFGYNNINENEFYEEIRELSLSKTNQVEKEGEHDNYIDEHKTLTKLRDILYEFPNYNNAVLYLNELSKTFGNVSEQDFKASFDDFLKITSKPLQFWPTSSLSSEYSNDPIYEANMESYNQQNSKNHGITTHLMYMFFVGDLSLDELINTILNLRRSGKKKKSLEVINIEETPEILILKLEQEELTKELRDQTVQSILEPVYWNGDGEHAKRQMLKVLKIVWYLHSENSSDFQQEETQNDDDVFWPCFERYQDQLQFNASNITIFLAGACNKIEFFDSIEKQQHSNKESSSFSVKKGHPNVKEALDKLGRFEYEPNDANAEIILLEFLQCYETNLIEWRTFKNVVEILIRSALKAHEEVDVLDDLEAEYVENPSKELKNQIQALKGFQTNLTSGLSTNNDYEEEEEEIKIIGQKNFDDIDEDITGKHGFQAQFNRISTEGTKSTAGNNMSFSLWGRCMLFQNPRLWYLASLTQTFALDVFSLEQENRLNFIKNNHLLQNKLRKFNQKKKNIIRIKGKNLEEPIGHGKEFFLPATYPNSKAERIQRSEDNQAIFLRYGMATYFITITCNPKHPDILKCVPKGGDTKDHSFWINRVFHLQLSAMLDDIRKGTFWGKRKSQFKIHVIEFQKRGLPHAHILVRVSGPQPKRPEEIDTIISAQCPRILKCTQVENDLTCTCAEHVTRRVILGLMKHGCRADKCLVKKTGKCNRGYNDNRPVHPITTFNEQGKCIYKREKMEDNKIVPHSVGFILKYRTNMNIEMVHSIHVTGYLSEYLYKDFDTIKFAKGVINYNDRCNVHQQMRCISAGDALWRLSGFVSQHRDIGVERIEVNLPGEESYQVHFDEHGGVIETKERLNQHYQYFARPNHPLFNDLVITEYFEMMDVRSTISKSKKLRISKKQYEGLDGRIINLPFGEREPKENDNFFIDQSAKIGEEQLNFNDINNRYVYFRSRLHIARLYNCSPTELERYCLRLLMLHIPARNFDDYKKSLDDQTIHTSYQNACLERMLIENDKEWELFFKELAKKNSTPQDFRIAFVNMMLFCGVGVVANELLNQFAIYMALDIENITMPDDLDTGRKPMVCNKNSQSLSPVGYYLLLSRLDDLLSGDGKTTEDFTLPKKSTLLDSLTPEEKQTILQHQLSAYELYKSRFDIPQLKLEAKEKIDMFTHEQKSIFNVILWRMKSQFPNNLLPDDLAIYHDQNIPPPPLPESGSNAIIVDCGAGRGKTFLLSACVSLVRSCSFIALPTASTGLVATLYDEAFTAHRQWKLPLDPNKGQANLDLDDYKTRLMKECVLVILDEIVALNAKYVQMIDDYFRFLTGDPRPFGGKLFIGAGDFRQTLPIIKESYSHQESIDACIRKHSLWKEFTVCSMYDNLRCLEKSYSDWTDSIGLGIAPGPDDSKPYQDLHRIRFPDFVKTTSSFEELYKFVHPNLENPDVIGEGTRSARRTILCPLNKTVDEHNETCLKRIPGECKVYQATNTESLDNHHEEDSPQIINAEYMRSFVKPGIPNDQIKLKVGAAVMVTRNLLANLGIMNGTKAVILEMGEHLIKIRTVPPNSSKPSIETYLNRINFTVETKNGSFNRKQFPLRLAYAQTINKSQGQTNEKTGVDTSEYDCFAHGQTYVSGTRSICAGDIIFCISAEKKFMNNIVHREVLPEAALIIIQGSDIEMKRKKMSKAKIIGRILI